MKEIYEILKETIQTSLNAAKLCTKVCDITKLKRNADNLIEAFDKIGALTENEYYELLNMSEEIEDYEFEIFNENLKKYHFGWIKQNEKNQRI